MILLFGKNIGQLGVVPKSESVVLPQSRVVGNFEPVADKRAVDFGAPTLQRLSSLAATSTFNPSTLQIIAASALA
jgi:hypothetical protein